MIDRERQVLRGRSVGRGVDMAGASVETFETENGLVEISRNQIIAAANSEKRSRFQKFRDFVVEKNRREGFEIVKILRRAHAVTRVSYSCENSRRY